MKEKNYMSNQIHQVGHLLLNPFSEKNKQKRNQSKMESTEIDQMI